MAELTKRYECTEKFVRLSLHGERHSERAELIRKDYERMCKKVEMALAE